MSARPYVIVGYINDELKHALLSISPPALANLGDDFVQVAISIEQAIELRAALNQFLVEHGIKPN